MSGKRIGVNCTFTENGTIRVRRIKVDDAWRPVEQGRQWMAADGRHLLIMIAGGVREIVLYRDTLVWELLPDQSKQTMV